MDRLLPILLPVLLQWTNLHNIFTQSVCLWDKILKKKLLCHIFFFLFFILGRALFRKSSLLFPSLTGVGWHHDALSYGILGLCQACSGSMNFPGTYWIFETWRRGVGSNIESCKIKMSVTKCYSNPVNWEFSICF